MKKKVCVINPKFFKAIKNKLKYMLYFTDVLFTDSGMEIIDLIDKSVESVDQKSWNEVRKRVDENKKVIENLDNTMKVAG